MAGSNEHRGYNTNMKSESWCPIKSFETLYEVSDLGRVRSLPRMTPHGIRGGVILKRRADGIDGRPKVGLYKDAVRTDRKVHLLVLETFKGMRPSSHHQACHNDGDIHNNRLDNLRWDTRVANHADSVRHGTAVPPKPIFKLTPEQAREVSRRRNAGEECLPIARDFGITRQHVGVLARRLQL